jgi:hypothetical protein
MLAVINESELILSAEQSKRFLDLGLGDMVNGKNFASGNVPNMAGSVGGGTTIQMGGFTVNAGNKSPESAKETAKQLQSLIEQTLIAQQRPGGILA